MHSVSVSRTVAAPPESVEARLRNLEPFMRSAGFDHVAVDGDDIHVANQVGPVEINLALEVVDDPDAALAYTQTEGIFEEMRTCYELARTGDGTDVTATTRFSLDVALVGDVLDATVIDRQRRRELAAQLDYLERSATD